ncbi:uncharacterized protein LOC135696069 [Rhopilema esculentum]|uniref:uncharacterized protein LOC135696069 n=1 Tax=Rhopilema esculentum TaxID=499914 RepID=UPI0031CE4F90
MAEFQTEPVGTNIAIDTEHSLVSSDQLDTSVCRRHSSSTEDLFNSKHDSIFEAHGETSCEINEEKLDDCKEFDIFQDDDHDFDDENWWPSPPDLGVENSSTACEILQTVCNAALENFDVILQRTTRERSSELNELQNTARPVTGTSARQNLLQFFSRDTNSSSVSNQNSDSQPSEDIQSLIQRSIVSSALRRHEFRSALEQSLATRLMPQASATSNSITRIVQEAARSISGASTPSLHTQDFETASVISETTTNDFSDAASEIEHLQRVLDAGVQVLSETIEEDIAQIRHLHVVSSVLGGSFRNNLERLFQERAQNVGGGEIVEQFIRSLPRSNRQPPRTANHSNISQRRTSSRPMTGTQRQQLTTEVNSLKTQMDEMKRMLQTTLEIQMETQRSIRQEVSAVFAAFMEQVGQASGSVSSNQFRIPERDLSGPVSAGSCVICLDNQVDTVLYQCGHMCVCNMCGLQLKMDGHRCPMCRAPIRDVIKAYKAQ